MTKSNPAQEELLDIVDKHDTPRGTASKSEAITKGLLHRRVRVFLFDAEGRTLILQQLSEDQKSNWMNITGIVLHEETPLQAACMHTQETVGLSLEPSCYFFVFQRNHYEKNTCYIEHVYAAALDRADTKKFDLPTEKLTIRWLHPREIGTYLTHPSVSWDKGLKESLRIYRRIQGNCPSKQQAYSMLTHNNPHTTVHAHCKKVAEVARKVAKHLARKSRQKIDMRLVEAGALLHDVMKLLQNPHEEKAALMLESIGFEKLGKTVLTHGLYHIEQHYPKTIEQKIVFYADKRVSWDKVVRVHERFEDLALRYPNADPQRRVREKEYTLMIEKELMVSF